MGGIDEILSQLSEEQKAELIAKLAEKESVKPETKRVNPRKLPSSRSGMSAAPNPQTAYKKRGVIVPLEKPDGTNKFDELGLDNEFVNHIEPNFVGKPPKNKNLEDLRNDKWDIDCFICGKEYHVSGKLIAKNHDGTYSYTCEKCLSGKLHAKSK